MIVSHTRNCFRSMDMWPPLESAIPIPHGLSFRMRAMARMAFRFPTYMSILVR